jgi:hypothetical protein
MNAGPDVERRISDYLAEQTPTRAPDRILPATFERTRHARQRRFGAAWRSISMNRTWQLATAAVVGVLIIGLGVVFISRSQGGVGAPPASSPTIGSSPTPSSSPPASPANLTPGTLCTGATCLSGALDPGMYAFDAGKVTPVPFSFAVPAGWAVDAEGFVKKHAGAPDEVYMTAWTISHIYGDACHRTGTLVAVGSTADDLTTALAVQKGRVASPATDVTVGGFPGKRITLTVPADTDVTTCEAGVVRVWPDPGPDESGGLCCSAAGSTDVVTSVDVAGQRLVVIARHEAGSSSADQAELQAIVDSIAIEPPAAGSPAGSVSPSP